LGDGVGDLLGSTLEGDNRSGLGEFRLELGYNEVSCEKSETESDGDAKVLEIVA